MTERATIKAGEHDVLIVVDVQLDFLPGGALAVPEGDAVIAPINRLAKLFRHVVLTQDWHPEGHASFASSHPEKQPFEVTELHYGPQVLWPNHCVQGTPGAEISPDLDIPHAQLVIRKGYNARIDSYSGFKEADRRTSTGLAGYLKERGFSRVFCVGLALDFCVAWTALDAVEAGFDTYLIEDASRAIDTDGSLARARRDMEAAGVHVIRSEQILGAR
ncbi:bifunctional nicotinamidase/pyrazinamidase [Microvirga mediterraneensis]|uniref:Nicotinamidase n=1 Tax=Microvirga mediterraneensis TaxID=2754695 RepID=A0A838BQ07_9HYPH|nr:bifunctional nicotinamidase/pyrazinamidase [Microvirga mediterraneensis]MBA1157002.1 bifunctional nicotinamidase/pyrazinamidase [Microvirga mediterraneensis]